MITDREQLDDPLPPPPNCLTAFTVMVGRDGSVSAHADLPDTVVPGRAPTMTDLHLAMQVLLFESQQNLLVERIVQALASQRPLTPAEAVVEGLKKRRDND